MSTLGFKCSWMKDEKKTVKEETIEQLPPLIPGSAVSFVLELQVKIMKHQEYMLSKAFTRLTVAEKTKTLEEYTFLVRALTTIQMPSETVASGFQEYAAAAGAEDVEF